MDVAAFPSITIPHLQGAEACQLLCAAALGPVNAQQQGNDLFERPFLAVRLSEQLMPVEMPVGAQAQEVVLAILSLAAAGRQMMVVRGWKLDGYASGSVFHRTFSRCDTSFAG